MLRLRKQKNKITFELLKIIFFILLIFPSFFLSSLPSIVLSRFLLFHPFFFEHRFPHSVSHTRRPLDLYKRLLFVKKERQLCLPFFPLFNFSLRLYAEAIIHIVRDTLYQGRARNKVLNKNGMCGIRTRNLWIANPHTYQLIYLRLPYMNIQIYLCVYFKLHVQIDLMKNDINLFLSLFK